jgi:toxin HigB-1
MISSFRDDWLRAFFVDDVHSRNIAARLGEPAFSQAADA